MIYLVKHLLVVLVCLALLVSAPSCTCQPGGKRLELQLEKAPRLNEAIELTCICTTPRDILNEKVDVNFRWIEPKHDAVVKVPAEEVLVQGDFNWEAAVTKDAPVEFSAIINFPHEGNWGICAVSYSLRRESDCVFVHIAEESGMFGWQEDYRPNTGPSPSIPGNTRPIVVELDISEAPRLDEPVDLTWNISTIRDVSEVQAKIEFYRMEGTDRVKVPVEDVLIKGDLTWEGALEKDTSVRLSAIVRFPQEGDWEVEALAHSSETTGGSNYPLFLSIGKDKGRWGWEEPHEKKPDPGTPHPSPDDYKLFQVGLDMEKTPCLNEPVRLTCTLTLPSEDITASARVSFRGPATWAESL